MMFCWRYAYITVLLLATTIRQSRRADFVPMHNSKTQKHIQTDKQNYIETLHRHTDRSTLHPCLRMKYYAFFVSTAKLLLLWLVMCICPIMWKNNIHKTGKVEIRKVLYCRERRTEPQPQVTRTKHFHIVWMCGFWDMQTDIHTHKQTRWS